MHYDLDESLKHLVEQKNLGRKENVLYDPIYMRVQDRQQSSGGGRQTVNCPGIGADWQGRDSGTLP